MKETAGCVKDTAGGGGWVVKDASGGVKSEGDAGVGGGVKQTQWGGGGEGYGRVGV